MLTESLISQTKDLEQRLGIMVHRLLDLLWSTIAVTALPPLQMAVLTGPEVMQQALQDARTGLPRA